jgi:hypothetical protein
MNPTSARRQYPYQIEGELSPELNRWLWLVKWLLVIPHVIALVLRGSRSWC